MQHTMVGVVRGKAAGEKLKYEDLGKNGVKALTKVNLYLNFRNVRRGAGVRASKRWRGGIILFSTPVMVLIIDGWFF